MKMISKILNKLSQNRPVFHSEADFQHALAWELHRLDSGGSIRLEQRKTINHKNAYIDIIARVKNKWLCLELKYKTRRLIADVKREHFELAAHGAQDIGAWMFWEDVSRLEQLSSSDRSISHAYAIFITNDFSYWTVPRRLGNAEAFRLYDGRKVAGELKWGPRTGDGTKKGYEAAITLAGEYELKWMNFSEINDERDGRLRNGQFRYLLLEIRKPRP